MLRTILVFFILFSALAAPVAAQSPTCGDLPQRLVSGEAGRVLYKDGTPLNVRSGAGRQFEVTTRLPEGTDFRVTDGLACDGGMSWWSIEAGDVTGWAAEGADGEYFVTPLTVDQYNASAALAERLQTPNPNAGFILMNSNRDFQNTDWNLNPVDTPPATIPNIVAPDVDVTSNRVERLLSPDGITVAWFYDVTQQKPDFECGPNGDCIGNEYDLYLAGVDGSNPRLVWQAATGYYDGLTLDRWQSDGEAVFFTNTTVVPGPDYPEPFAYLRVKVDGTEPAMTQLFGTLSSAFSDDGLWKVDYDQSESHYFIESADGTRLEIPKTEAFQFQWSFSADNRYLLWADTLYGDTLQDLQAIRYWALDLQSGEHHLVWSFIDIPTRDYESLFFVRGWLADDLVVVTQNSNLYILDVVNGGSAARQIPAGNLLRSVLYAQ